MDLLGLSGDFSSSDIEALQDCLPPGSILSVEVDSKVPIPCMGLPSKSCFSWIWGFPCFRVGTCLAVLANGDLQANPSRSRLFTYSTIASPQSQVRHAESLVSSRAATAMLEAKQGMNSDGQPVHLRRVASQDLHRRTMRMAPSSRVSEGQRGRQLKFQHNTTLERRGSASAEYSEKNQIDDAAPWGSLSLRGPSLASVLSSAVGLGTRFNGPAWESGFMISGDRLVRTAIKISQGVQTCFALHSPP